MSDEELETFVQIEKELANDISSTDNFSTSTSFKEDQSLLDIQDAEIILNYQKLVDKIQEKTKELKRGKKELRRAQKKFAREKAQFESDQILNGADVERFTKLAVKYTQLQEKYKKSKNDWKSEKKDLEKEIEKKDEMILKLQSKVIELEKRMEDTHFTPKIKVEEENSEFYEEEIQKTKSSINKSLNYSPIFESKVTKNSKIDVSPIKYENRSPQTSSNKSKLSSHSKEQSEQIITFIDDSSSSSVEDLTGGVVIRTDEVQDNQRNSFVSEPRFDTKKLEYLLNNKYPITFQKIPTDIVEEKTKKNGRKILKFGDGSKGVFFQNGSLKLTRGDRVFVYYANGDISQKFPDGAVAYSYSKKGTIELNMPNGSTLYKFPTGQIELHYSNGEKDISYPNGTFKHVDSVGASEIFDADGSPL